MGIPPTGKKAQWASMGFFRVADGKIVEHWGSPDLLTLLMQTRGDPVGGGAGRRAGAGRTRRRPRGRIDPEEGKRILRHYVEDEFNRHDLSELDDIARSATTSIARWGWRSSGVDGLQGDGGAACSSPSPTSRTRPRRSSPRATWSPPDGSATGTHLGPFMGIPATGKPVELTGMTIERIAGGKRLEGWGVPDMLGLMRQLGVGPGAPAG